MAEEAGTLHFTCNKEYNCPQSMWRTVLSFTQKAYCIKAVNSQAEYRIFTLSKDYSCWITQALMINYTVLLQLSFMEHKAVLVGWHTPAKYIFMEWNPTSVFTVLTSCAYIYTAQLSLWKNEICCAYTQFFPAKSYFLKLLCLWKYNKLSNIFCLII